MGFVYHSVGLGGHPPKKSVFAARLHLAIQLRPCFFNFTCRSSKYQFKSSKKCQCRTTYICIDTSTYIRHSGSRPDITCTTPPPPAHAAAGCQLSTRSAADCEAQPCWLRRLPESWLRVDRGRYAQMATSGLLRPNAPPRRRRWRRTQRREHSVLGSAQSSSARHTIRLARAFAHCAPRTNVLCTMCNFRRSNFPWPSTATGHNHNGASSLLGPGAAKRPKNNNQLEIFMAQQLRTQSMASR